MEWTVVMVIIALAGFFAAVAKPIIKLNTTITKLTVVVDTLQRDVEGLTSKNTDSHRRLWEKSSEQGVRIDDHEKRITIIEQK